MHCSWLIHITADFCAGIDTWRRYAHAPFGIVNSFGLSAPAEQIYAHFGFSLDNLTARASQVRHYLRNDVLLHILV